MVTCAVVSCPNRTNKDRADNKKGVRFFNIPKVIEHQCSLTKSRTQRRRALWLSRINRKDLQDADVKPYTRVCSIHFVSGSPSALWDENNPDWAPSVDMGYSSSVATTSTSCKRYERAKRRAETRLSDPPSSKLAVAAKEIKNVNFSSASARLKHLESLVGVGSQDDPENLAEDTHEETSNFSEELPMEPVEAGLREEGVGQAENADNDGAVSVVNNEATSVAEQDSCEQPVPREAYDCLQKDHIELRKCLQKVRDQLTDAEVDKLELQASLKSAESSAESLRAQLKEKDEECTSKLKQQEAHIRQEYEKRVQDGQEEIKKLRKSVEEIEELTLRNLTHFSSKEDKVKFYTGLPSFAVFKVVLDTVTLHMSKQSVDLGRFTLEPWQCLLLTLMRLRLCLTLQDLAYRFGVSATTAGRTFDRWIDAMYICLFPVMVKWPDRETLWETMPRDFREAYGNSVAVIIDCFEVFTEKPSSLETRAVLWSNYKHHHTVKILVGISPTGAIIFVSSAWGARASDKHVVQESGLYELLLPHDVVMADRGFTIAEDLALHQAKLLIPAFTRGQDQLSSHDVTLTRKIANLRIHVERVIGLVRNKFRILKSILPVELLVKKGDSDVAPIDKIVRVCCALVNMCPSIVVHPEIHD